MALDVAFHGVPLTVLVPNLLAARTDGQDPPQDFDLLQGLLQLLFPGLATVHFAFELQRRAQPCQQLQAVDRFGDVVHSPGGKRRLQECPCLYRRHHKDGQIPIAFVRLDPAARFHPVRIAHHDVHQDQLDSLGRSARIREAETLKRLVGGFRQHDLLIPGAFQNRLQLASGFRRVIHNENAHGSVHLQGHLEPSSLSLSGSGVKRRSHCCRHRSTIGTASNSQATTNTGQLNWVGSTWATASAPPPAAPMASAMNTYSASATPTRFAPHAQGPGQSARSGRSNRLTNVPPRTISTAMLTGASTGPHHGSGSRNRMSQSTSERGQPLSGTRKT